MHLVESLESWCLTVDDATEPQPCQNEMYANFTSDHILCFKFILTSKPQ